MKKRYLFIIFLIVIIALFSKTKDDIPNIVFDNGIQYKYEVSKKVENGIIENIGMEYIDCGSVEIKLEKLKISEINTELIMSFKQKEKQNLKYNCAIFDNKGNIYSFWCPSAFESKSNSINKEIIRFCKRHNIKYDYAWGNLKTSETRESDLSIISMKDNITTTRLVSYSDIGFGNSRNPEIKMNQKMGDICYIEIWDLNDNKPFIIEFNLSKNFYKDSQIEYKQVNKANDFKLDKAVCDDTSFLLVAEISGFDEMRKNFITSEDGKTDMDKFNEWYNNEMDKCLYISDENGNNYYHSNEKTTVYVPIGNLDRITAFYNITDKVATEKLYIHIIIDGTEKIIELDKK